MRALVLFLADVYHAVILGALTVWIVWQRAGAWSGLLAAATILTVATTPREQ